MTTAPSDENPVHPLSDKNVDSPAELNPVASRSPVDQGATIVPQSMPEPGAVEPVGRPVGGYTTIVPGSLQQHLRDDLEQVPPTPGKLLHSGAMPSRMTAANRGDTRNESRDGTDTQPPTHQGSASTRKLAGPEASADRAPVKTLLEVSESYTNPATGAVIPRLPGHEILGELGRGGMGVVYKARQLALNRLVAIKMVIGGGHAGPEQVARFQAEARSVAALQHPNIVQIYEVGEWQSLPYFTLEFVDGGTLDKTLKGQPQTPEQAARLTETLARAMQFAHERGIVRRDLKPQNVLLTATGEPKITDFGLAKNIEGEASQTKSGALMGTPSYMSPEQARGDHKSVGPLADIHSLGGMLYEFLVGRPPFLGSSSMETLMQVLRDDPVPPTRLVPKTPVDLETICLKCLQKDPAKRYQSAAELAEDCRRFLAGEPILSRPISKIERLSSWCRRNPRTASLIATVAALLVVVSVGSIASAYLIHGQRQEALRAQKAAEIAESQAIESEKAAKAAEQLALRNAEEASKNARKAQSQSDLALKTLQLLVRKVQEQLSPVPGMQDLKKSLLQTAVEGLEEVANQSYDATSVEATKVSAHMQMGTLFRTMGASEQSLREFERAYEIAKNRAADQPRNAASQGNLAVILMTIGDVRLEFSRDLNRAIEDFETARLILEKLTQTPPAQLDKYDALEQLTNAANANMRIGVTNLRLGRPAKAISYFQQALEIRKKILATSENSPAFKISVAGAHQAIAEAQFSFDNLAAARQEYEQAERLVIGAWKDHPDAAVLQEQVAIVSGNFGELLLRVGELEAARQRFDQSSQLLVPLAAADQRNLNRQRALALCYYRQGTLEQLAGDQEASQKAFQECRQIREKISEIDPTNQSRRMELMLALARVGQHEQADLQAKELLLAGKDDREVLVNVARGWAQCSVAQPPLSKELMDSYQQLACDALKFAYEAGYRDRRTLQSEPDLAPLKSRADFQQLLETMTRMDGQSEK